MRTSRRVLAFVLSLSSASAFAQTVDPDRVAQIKAAFLLNFVRYTTWPASSFSSSESPYRVTVIDSERVAAHLEEIARRAGTIGGRGIRVVHIGSGETVDAVDVAEDLRRSHVVYLGDTGPARERIVRAAVAGHDVLTVGDRPGFAAGGGMIGLRRDGDRLVFDGNPRAIRSTGLIVSARVLQLARIVEGAAGQ